MPLNSVQVNHFIAVCGSAQCKTLVKTSTIKISVVFDFYLCSVDFVIFTILPNSNPSLNKISFAEVEGEV